MGWFGNLGKSLLGGVKKLWGSVGGVKGLTKKLGQVSDISKKVGDVTKSAAPMLTRVLGEKRAGQLQSGIEKTGQWAGRGKRAAQLAEDTAEDVGSLRKAWKDRDPEAAFKAGKRAYGRSKGARRFIG